MATKKYVDLNGLSRFKSKLQNLIPIIDANPTENSSNAASSGSVYTLNSTLTSLNDDISTLPDGTKASSAGEAVRTCDTNLKKIIKEVTDFTGYKLLNCNYQHGSYKTTGVNTTDKTRAYCIFENINKLSHIRFNGIKYGINYYYITSLTDFTPIYTPNIWDYTGDIELTRNGILYVSVRKLDNTAITSDELAEINNTVNLYNFITGINYHGLANGTSLADNVKNGFYSVGNYQQSVFSDFTDMPCSNFLGGFLFNTRVGGYDTAILQILYEFDSNRVYRRIVGQDWNIQGEKPNSTGRKWVAFGDSITHGSYSTTDGQTLNGPTRGYAYRISRYFKDDILEFYNCGVRGIGWVNTGNQGETMQDMLALFTGDKTEIDLVTIMLGINDYLSNETLGTINSEENDGTISGAIRYTLKYLGNNYPNAKIVVISPLNSTLHGNANTSWSRYTSLNNAKTLQDVSDMVKYWCNKYGITFIDVLTQGFINNYNIENLEGDGIHPTDNGQWLLAKEVNKYI